MPPEQRKAEPEGPKPILFADFADNDFLPWSETQHSRNHYVRQRDALHKHLFPFFEGRYLRDIAAKEVEDYKSARLRMRYAAGKKQRPVNKATVNRELSCIKGLFKQAVEWGYLEISPAEGVRRLKETPKETRLLEADEVARLLDEMPDRLKALVACAVYAGLRKGELFHLQWRDIKWPTGELYVVSRKEHHTKNYQTRRIPTNDALQDALRRHPAWLVSEEVGKIERSPYVFSNASGKPYARVDKALRNAAQRAGIEGAVTLHPLRHAFCSHALMQGIDPRTVQKWMGHKDLKTTLRYAHVSPDHEREAIQRLRYKDNSEKGRVEVGRMG